MNWFENILYSWIAIPIILFPILLKVRAPYGRHTKSGWGPMIDNHWGWFWMEVPALLTFPLLATFGPTEKDPLSWLLIGLWCIHYFNRVIIFPFRLKTKGKKMPLFIAMSAVFFNLMNGFVNGYYIGFVDGKSGSMISIFVFLGILLFFAGYIINNIADTRLIALRRQGSGYQIPKGWLFNFISCPNHFGEIVEWIGFAIVARNPAALSFAIWTFCNLAPRAKNHHDWYRETFEDYPKERKVVLPYIW
jgi:isoprenylcysteine carboxyl methyltransferase (ICMT) family protein YpbQ